MDAVHIPWPEDDGPFLTRLFQVRQRVARELDKCLHGVAPPSGCHVLVYNETDAGLGDVAFATKLLRLIRTHMPTVGLTLVSTDEDKQRTFGLPDGVRLFGEAQFREEATEAQRSPTLVVSAPGIFDHCRVRHLAYERLGIVKDVPFQYVAEYGSLRQLKDDAFKGMMEALEALTDGLMDTVAAEHGLSPDDMGHSAKTGAVVGVFGDEVRPLDHLLRAYVRPGSPMAQWLHQPLLGARSTGLAPGEMGIHVDRQVPVMVPRIEALSEVEDAGVRELLLGDMSVEAYGAEAALYVGYAYDGLALFVDYISILEAASDHRIDVVVPHRGAVSDLAETVFDDAALARLKTRGVGRVVLVGNSVAAPDTGPVGQAQIALGAGKTLRLITRYPIPHADFRRLHEAAQPATMVTGDQSFSEAVSGGKAVLYLEPAYCKTWHLDAVLDLAGRVGPPAREVLDFGMQYRFDEGRYPAVQRHLGTPRLTEAYREFNATIQRDHDCGPALMDLLTRALWTVTTPSVGAAARVALEAAWAGAHPDRGLTLTWEHLSALRQAAEEVA